MEKNTVILDLKRYHKLKDLEEAIGNKDVIEIVTGHSYHSGFNRTYSYRSFIKSDAINDEIIEINEKLKKDNEKLKKDNSELSLKLENVNKILEKNSIKLSDEPKKYMVDISKLSMWQLIIHKCKSWRK